MMKKNLKDYRNPRWVLVSLLTLLLLLSVVLPQIIPAQAADVTDGLDVEIIAAYNLIVDSNVMSPSTKQPVVATVIGKFCNTDASNTLTNVVGYIGDYSSNTPGDYPDRVGPFSLGTAPDDTTYLGTYEFLHLGGTADASRFIGTLSPGACSYQYWSFTYPKYATDASGTIPAWGRSVKPDDDLSLDFQIWGTGTGAPTTTDHETWTMTMRNEISAMANKIKPNGNPGGEWFNTNTSTVLPGETLTTNGILYRLGNINQGFDNDNSGTPDYNAWLQPFGDPAYDPSCFRLISTSGVLTVTTTTGDVIIPIDNNLYFTDLPPNNTNVVGKIYYEFLALGGACTIPISPYQEAASGFDNEKFNGDYGTGVPPLMTYDPLVTLSKTAPDTAAAGTTFTYAMDFANNSTTTAAGLSLSVGNSVNAGLMISDTIPAGLVYVAGSAGDAVPASTNSIPSGNSVTIRYYDTSTSSWTTTEPAAANVSIIQWWLDEPLDADDGGGTNSGTVRYQATIPGSYGGDPFIENCATSHFGDAAPFAESCDTTMVQGTNSIGDYVWADVDTDGVQDVGETGINSVDVWLYWDEDSDGALDDNEGVIATTTTANNGSIDGYYEFTGLPNASYIVKVDFSDVEALLAGYNYTTPKEVAVTNLSGGVAGTLTVDTADFGFGPILNLTKTLANGEYDGVDNDNLYEGQIANYSINVINTRPGGTGPGNTCQYFLWTDTAAGSGPANSNWRNMPNILGTTDTAVAYTTMTDNSNVVVLGGYFAPDQGNITNVKYVAYLNELVDLKGTDKLEVLIEQGATELFADDTSFTGSAYFTQSLGTVYEVTADFGTTLTWADFASNAANPIAVTLTANPGGGAGSSGDLGLDGAAFIITTDEVCGDPTDTLNPVPVVDTYNSTELEFVSANPPISSKSEVGPGSTLTWNNVGPLASGETQQINVVFKVLTPVSPFPDVFNNAAESSTAKYLDGRDTNDVSDDVDADVFEAYTIGDYVWFDADGDGNQEAGEPGLAGVVVDLYFRGGNNTVFYNGTIYNDDELIATAVTDANGAYTFEGVLGGETYHDYEVVVNVGSSPILTGLSLTTSNEPYPIANLAADVLDADFGYNGNSIVYGYVWQDADGGADIDPTENYISGVIVYLDDGTCTPITNCPSITTDENGLYQFTNVTDGPYTITIVPPGSQVSEPTGEDTMQVCGTCDNTFDITVVNATDSVNGGFNFGYIGADIGDTLYVDWDGSGSQNTTTEEGIPNVDVYLYQDLNSNGVVDAGEPRLETVTTNASGYYLFADYPAGDYLVVVDTGDPDFPGSYVQTADPDVTLDSKHALTTDGVTAVDTVDFGYQPQGTSSIGDYVWNDVDGDGKQDTSEPGITGVVVTLYQDQDGDGVVDTEDAVVSTATTDANGGYLFDYLAAGNYIVKVDDSNFGTSQPLGSLTHTNPQTGVVDNLHTVALGSAEDYLEADFGYAESSIGDLIWSDDNGDGLFNGSETGIENVRVYLCAANAATCDGSSNIAFADTDASGLYLFAGLAPGNYNVVVDTGSAALANYTLSGDPDAYNTNSSDPSISCLVGTMTGCDSTYTLDEYTTPDGYTIPGLQVGQNNMGADFGYVPYGTIGDTLWLDFDADGVRDVGEPGVVGVTVELYTGGGVSVDTTTTDANGNYIFNGLVNGIYEVLVNSGTDPAGLNQNYDKEGGNGCAGTAACDNSGFATISLGSTVLDVDFGYIGDYSLSGTVGYDPNQDTLIDSGELIRYSGVNIYLWDCGADTTCGTGDDVFLGTTITDGNGDYIFGGLPNGDYRVVVNPDTIGLKGLSPTAVGSPTTQREPSIVGSDSVNNDFGFLSSIDFGDLPSGYDNTLVAKNGARHLISSNLYLGSAEPDNDANGQESSDAGLTNPAPLYNGDDHDADGNDDDGVTRMPGLGGAINGGGWTDGTVSSGNGGSLNIQIGGTWSGVPQVFIDFDGDDATYTLTEVTLRDASGDPIAMPLAPNVTPYRVYFDVPGGTFPGGLQNNTVYIRVRLSSTGGLSAYGLASNGEVEDYQSNFGPNAVSLAGFSASTGGAPVWGVALIVLVVILVVGAAISSYRKREPNTTIHFQ